MKTDFSLAAMSRILRSQGNIRVSEEAERAMAEELQILGEEIAEKAVALAKHAGRRTVKGDDVKLAVRA